MNTISNLFRWLGLSSYFSCYDTKKTDPSRPAGRFINEIRFSRLTPIFRPNLIYVAKVKGTEVQASFSRLLLGILHSLQGNTTTEI